MSITKANADTYFAATNHPRASVWAAFSTNQKTGAVAHAKRIVSRYLRSSLDETVTVDGDFPRHDLAVYEQSLWSLENSPILSDGREEAAEAIADDPEEQGNARSSSGNILAPEARRWLAQGGGVTLERG